MNQGFLKIIILLIVVIIILSLFKIRISAIFENQFVKENFGFIWNAMKSLWNKYLAQYLDGPINYAIDYIREMPLKQTWTELMNKFPHPWTK